MSDLIDRQAAINAADRADYRGLTVEDVRAVTDEVVKELKALPTIDAVPVVWCKDCRFFWKDVYHKDGLYYCVRYANLTVKKPDDFCSMAERITDEAD